MEPRGNMKSVSILGSGSWALALSKILKPNKLVIKCRDTKKEKAKFKSHNIILTDSFDKVIQTQTVFIAIPSQSVRQNLIDLRHYKTSQQEKKYSLFVLKE